MLYSRKADTQLTGPIAGPKPQDSLSFSPPFNLLPLSEIILRTGNVDHQSHIHFQHQYTSSNTGFQPSHLCTSLTMSTPQKDGFHVGPVDTDDGSRQGFHYGK